MSCIKEYSYEGGFRQIIHDSIPAHDTIPESTHLPSCSQCKDLEIVQGTWNFKFDTSIMCGKITDAIKSPDGNGFTFFGPSTCSRDTGIILTVFARNQSLDVNFSDVTFTDVIFEYYDNKNQRDIFMWEKKDVFMLTVKTYDVATRLMTGTFRGYVSTWDNLQQEVTAGNFFIKFRE